jgi:hypothetical protein
MSSNQPRVTYTENRRKYRTMPFALGAIDKTFEGGMHDFPGVPWVMIYILDLVFARKYRSVWRFCPSTIYGQPRPLQFIESYQ